MFWYLRVLALALSFQCCALLTAQAHPGCMVRPASLAQMRDCYRPLLVFAPASTDRRLLAQRGAMDSAADDMMDRNVLLVPVLEETKRFTAPLDTPFVLLSPKEMAAVRRQYGIGPGTFKVLLLGEDGSVKLRSNTAVDVERLNSLIDTMPSRKLEMQRPHAN